MKALCALCRVDVDSPCSEFDGGTPLHVAAQNLAVDTARVLLANAAYPFAVDFSGRQPLGTTALCHSLLTDLLYECCFVLPLVD